jgi:acyl-CoA thioesterase FadM
MSRLLKEKINFVGEYVHKFDMNVRASDMILGAHVSNSNILLYNTEALADFLAKKNMKLSNVNGCSCMFNTVVLRYQKEVIYPEILTIRIGIFDVSKYRITFYYVSNNSKGEVCHKSLIETIYIDNETRKIAPTDSIIDIYRS